MSPTLSPEISEESKKGLRAGWGAACAPLVGVGLGTIGDVGEGTLVEPGEPVGVGVEVAAVGHGVGRAVTAVGDVLADVAGEVVTDDVDDEVGDEVGEVVFDNVGEGEGTFVEHACGLTGFSEPG